MLVVWPKQVLDAPHGQRGYGFPSHLLEASPRMRSFGFGSPGERDEVSRREHRGVSCAPVVGVVC
jgi:hypothetical protein